jgi:uncharacterized protein (TIGR02145 family)
MRKRLLNQICCKVLILVFVFGISAINCLSQLSENIKYSLTIKDSMGFAVSNEVVLIEARVFEGSFDSEPIFSELHSLVTNSSGYVSFVLGLGEITSGNFRTIDFGIDEPILLSILRHLENGYDLIYEGQVTTVPFAFFSKDVSFSMNLAGDSIQIGKKWVRLPTTNNDKYSCSDTLACNYLISDQSDNSSCKYVGEQCDDGNLFSMNDVITNDCTCLGEVVSNGMFSYRNQISDFDGNIYSTIEINGLNWTTENLKVTHFNNGDIIPSGYSNIDWASLVSGAYCYYNDIAMGEYGLLYNWYTVSDLRGICPANWHVASKEDWENLIMFIDPTAEMTALPYESFIAGGKLKSKEYWNFPNVGASNEAGLSALPGGYRHRTGNYNHIGNIGHYWAIDSYNQATAFFVDMYTGNSKIKLGTIGKKYGFSIRCVKD